MYTIMYVYTYMYTLSQLYIYIYIYAHIYTQYVHKCFSLSLYIYIYNTYYYRERYVLEYYCVIVVCFNLCYVYGPSMFSCVSIMVLVGYCRISVLTSCYHRCVSLWLLVVDILYHRRSWSPAGGAHG